MKYDPQTITVEYDGVPVEIDARPATVVFFQDVKTRYTIAVDKATGAIVGTDFGSTCSKNVAERSAVAMTAARHRMSWASERSGSVLTVLS